MFGGRSRTKYAALVVVGLLLVLDAVLVAVVIARNWGPDEGSGTAQKPLAASRAKPTADSAGRAPGRPTRRSAQPSTSPEETAGTTPSSPTAGATSRQTPGPSPRVTSSATRGPGASPSRPPTPTPSQPPTSRPSQGATSSPTPSSTPASPTPPGPAPAALEVRLPTPTTPAFEPVEVRGRYVGADAGVRLLVERRTSAPSTGGSPGEWEAFPVPSFTRDQGRFSTFVELGEPGSYELRVRDPAAGLTSEVVLLEVT